MKFFYKFFLAVCLISTGLSFAKSSKAALDVNITQGHMEPINIAIVDMAKQPSSVYGTALNISQIIKDNLKNTGLFNPLDKNTFLKSYVEIDKKPEFNDWSVIGAKLLVYGDISETEDDKIKIKFFLWDIDAKELLTTQSITASKSDYRRTAHIISDVIYSKITGDSGYFDTRIVFVDETGLSTNRKRRLAIMDQDGHNLRYLSSGATSITTPAFSPTKQEITYMTYYKGIPRVYLFNIATGLHRLLGNFLGMSFAPRFTPDGESIIMSIAMDGKTDIFEMNLKSKKLYRLTDSKGIDTAPSYSPDGKQIAFISDRNGAPNIYVMDADGKNVNRISKQGGIYGDPAWSPRGDYIAFVKISGGKFWLGVMFPDGTGERLITEAYNLESPSWSPNGRRLIYYKQNIDTVKNTDDTKIYTIDVTGYGERQLPTPHDATDPAWSPLLK